MKRLDAPSASLHVVKRDLHVLKHDIRRLFESEGFQCRNKAAVPDLVYHLKFRDGNVNRNEAINEQDDNARSRSIIEYHFKRNR